ncbi:reverse transcriptase [Tanacetum coccineum]
MALATRNLTNTSANDEPVTRQEDVLGWNFKCDQFFLIDNTPKEEKSKGENVTWTEYKDAITLRFGSVYDDPMNSFKNAKYDKSAKEYQDTFDNLLSRVEVSEEHVISLYLGGLPNELEMSVRMFRLKTLSDAYCLTTLQEATLEAVKKKSRPFVNQTIGRFGVSNLNGSNNKYGKLYSLIVLADNEEEEEEYLDADESLVDALNEEVQAHISLNALFGVSSF